MKRGETRWASTYAVVVTSRVRSASPVVVGVDSGVGLVGKVAGVRSRVGRAVSVASRAKAAGGVAASVSRPAGIDVGVEGVASVSGVRSSSSASGAETGASVVGG